MSLAKYKMASRRQAALLRRRAVLRWRHALLRVRRRTSCFASTTYDVRRRALCFASTTRSAFPSRSACFARRVLLRCTQRTQPSVSQIACVVCPWLPFLSLSLSLGGGGPCFSFPFLSRRKNTGPGLRLLRAFFSMCAFYVFLLALQALQPKILARFAPLCAPRAINSTPGGGRPHLY